MTTTNINGLGKLTEKQRSFVEAYLTNGLNGKQAAIKAGYSAKVAEITAAKLLRSGKVADEISARTGKVLAKVSTRIDISVERVLDAVGKLAFFDPIDLFEDDGSLKRIKDMTPEARSVIEGLEVSDIWDGDGEQKSIIGNVKKIKLSPRRGALDMLMRYHSLYRDKLEVEVNDQFERMSMQELERYAATGELPAWFKVRTHNREDAA